jgi:hypothetical protein
MSELEPRPTGRPCSVCAHPQLDEIHDLLIDGSTFKAISDGYTPLSRNAVRRHALNHLPEAIAAEAQGTVGLTRSTLLERVHDVVRSAREVREEALQLGHHSTALRAGDAELRALSALATLGVRHEAEVESLTAQRVTIGVLKRSVRQSPELAELVAREFEAVDQPGVAESIRGFISRNKELQP